ncbi:trypsin-like peptidase domain-containing protein [Actinoplanes sp. NPDC023801]|uniref:VMAP-C domain-containing protein n=1 Tax=Actinoplanes sp. NPDC023801 TaxID=3154595 RepID=UPI0033FF60D6
MHVPDVIDDLTAHLRNSLVRVEGHTEGSGFFIAPNMIATCAHVAGARYDEIRVFRQGAELPAVVRWASPLGGRVTDYPDLAVVEVSTPDDNRSTVWLDDHVPRNDAKLLVAGHARVYGPSAARTSGWFTSGGDYDDMIRLTGDKVEPGMSGAPVLNATTGGVCAVTKATRHSGQSAGGVAVPVRALRMIMDPESYRRLRRDHDEHHRIDKQWLRLADQLPDRPDAIGRAAERLLRHIVHDLPAAEHYEHLADYRAIAGEYAPPVRHPLHDHGDVITELAGLISAADNFPHVLSYAIRLAIKAGSGSLTGSRLETWARSAGQAIRAGDRVDDRLASGRARVTAAAPARPEPRSSVLVYVRPVGRDQQRYRCEIWRDDSGGPEQIDPQSPDLDEEELWEHLRGRLPGLVRRDAAGYPRIELVLPPNLLDADVEHWPRAGRVSTELGQTSPVVVRDQERFDATDDEILGEWQDRWDAFADREIGAALMRVRCAEHRADKELFSTFHLAPDLGALVLPDSPRNRSEITAVLDIALYCGFPIVVWRRRGCAGGDEDHRECAGARLADAVTAALTRSRREDVPDQIMRMRNQALSDGSPECGRDIVVLWDDPGRRLGRELLRTPTKGRHDGG